MLYQKYTLSELQSVTSNISTENEKVYQMLFHGLDITMLQLMCTQVTWSLANRPKDAFITILLDYANQIIRLIPAWKKVSQTTSVYAKRFCESFTNLSNCFQQQDTEELRKQIRILKKDLSDCSKQSEDIIGSLQDMQSSLSAFISGKLASAVPDRTQWRNYGLERCLSNDKFIHGTEASIYNGSTMFSLVTATLQQSIDILEPLDPSWSIAEIIFTITGQTNVWNIIYKVSLRLEQLLRTFYYIPPYQPNTKGGITMYLEHYSHAEDMLKVVQETCKNISIKGKDKTKLAQQLLRLMGGDFNVLKELPSLNPSTNQLVWVRALDNLVEETSTTSIGDSKGLLGLTKENIIDIKTYVRTSLALKTTCKEEAQELGYTDDDPFSKEHPEFSPTAFTKFNEPFHTHALGWNKLEMDILQQGNNIQTYGTTFVSHADFVLNQIKNMAIFTAIEDVKITDPNDKKILAALPTILDRWKEETNKHSATTTDLLNRLNAFQNTLQNTLCPSANSMSQKLNKLDIQKETADLKEEIDSLIVEIEAKQKEYQKDCLLANSGAAGIVGGPVVLITWSVTGGVYGAKAEKVRKERNELKARLESKQTLYDNLNKVAAHVHNATSGIENLRLAVINAIIGLESLNTVWGLITSYIDEAKESMATINKKNDLMNFTFDMEGARAAWSSVPSLAAGLLKLFKEAEQSFKLSEDFKACLLHKEQSFIVSHADRTTWDDKYVSLNNIVINPASTYMPVLQSKSLELRNDAFSIYRTALQTFPTFLLSKGKMLMTNSDPEILDKLAEAIKNNPSDEQAIATFNFRINNLKKNADSFDEKLTELESCIHDNAIILNKNTRTDLSSIGFFAQLNNECKRFAIDIQSHTKLMITNFIEPMHSLAERMKTLDNEIETKIDPENLIKGFKEFLPSSSEISDMLDINATSAETQQLQIIATIYDTALKSLDVLANTITLCHQIEEQSYLATQLDNLQRSYNEINKSHQKLLDAQSELQQLLHLHALLKFFAEEGEQKKQHIQKCRMDLTTYLKQSPVDYANYHKLLSQWIDETTKESEVLL